jgi:hypothetical protein
MIGRSLISNSRIPFHIHHGENQLRILSIILLTTLIFFAIYSIKYAGYVMIALIFACLFGLVCIRFPKIFLYHDHFAIVKKCLISKYTDHDVFKYDDIIKVEFSESFTDRNYLIVVAIFGSGGFGGNSKADQMIVYTKDNKTYIFNRFGSRTKFLKTIELINKRISPKTSRRHKQSRHLD